MSYINCIKALADKAGRELTDAEVQDIYTRVHEAAKKIKKGIESGQEPMDMGGKTLEEAAAEMAAKEMIAEAARDERSANLQIVAMAARTSDIQTLRDSSLQPIDAVAGTFHRNYSGKVKVESAEQRSRGVSDMFRRKLLPMFDALGNDFLGIFQDPKRQLDFVRAMFGEKVQDKTAMEGGKAWNETADAMRQMWNDYGGNTGKVGEFYVPQHNSQERVSNAGNSPDPIVNQKAFVDDIWERQVKTLAKGDFYVDELGIPWSDARLREHLEQSWVTMATNGLNKREAGQFTGTGKTANRHAEERQIHWADAEDLIWYWNKYGEKTVPQILMEHIDSMSNDIALVQHYGPNVDMTYRTLRDQAMQDQALSDPRGTKGVEQAAAKLDNVYNYNTGKTKPVYREWLKSASETMINLNVAAKGGGFSLMSLIGDRPMMEAVSTLNNLPYFQRWKNQLNIMNPANPEDRRLIMQQGLMLDYMTSSMQRFSESLGKSTTSGKFANAVLRMTGMSFVNETPKGSFGITLMAAIGNQLGKGVEFGSLKDSDIRLLRNYGINEADWGTWKLAKRETLAGVDNVLTPDSIERIPDQALLDAGVITAVADANRARQNAIIKLLGAVNTEAEFAVITPGWKERAQMYGTLQRGTVDGEIIRQVLQFKSFPFTYLKRSMDALANSDGPVGKAIMASWLVLSATMAGAMLMQIKNILSGKDPYEMNGDKAMKFWTAAFVQGGASSIYGDFLFNASQTRYGSGVVEAMAGPTIGPLLELIAVHPMKALQAKAEGKPTHIGAQTLQSVKAFTPGANIIYTKAAFDRMIWHRAAEELSPGYLATMRQKSMKDFGVDWYWRPGEMTPERAPDLGRAIK